MSNKTQQHIYNAVATPISLYGMESLALQEQNYECGNEVPSIKITAGKKEIVYES